MNLPILTAAAGASWEERLISELSSGDDGIQLVRRCVDVVELLAVAAVGRAVAAVVDAGLRHFDSDAVDRLGAAGVVVVGVAAAGSPEDDWLRAVGIDYLVPPGCAAAVLARVIESAIAEVGRDPKMPRAFADPAFATGPLTMAPSEPPAPRMPVPAVVGSLIAVWGPTGAPGRTTLAVTLADELARMSKSVLLVDADVYGGVIAMVLGLLDESPGLAAACRQAQSRRLDTSTLAELAWQVGPNLRVLTGLPRADRWPELRGATVESVLSVGRGMADFTVVDVGFALESDEEITFDTLAPRRNGATLAILDAADLIVAVGAADPIGIHRLVRGLSELREAEIAAEVWPVLNRVRRGPVAGDPSAELIACLQRFAGVAPTALLPYDREALDSALATGKTVAEGAPHSRYRRAVMELSASLAGVSVPARGRRRK